MPNPSRRRLGSALLLAPLVAAQPAGASGTPQPVPPLVRRRIGRFEVTLLLDGHADFPPGFFTGLPEAEMTAAVQRLRMARPEGVRTSFTQWLIRDGQRLILVDAGTAGTVSPTSGRLPAALAALGLRPEQIDAVVVTHLHVDHVAGLVAGERRVFPQAEILVDRRDAAHFTDPAKAAAAPAFLRSSFDKAAELFRLYSRVQRVDPPRQVAPGVSLVDLSGHTPGQIGVRIEDGGEALVLASDMLFHPAVHPARSDVGFVFEQDPAAANAARARFFDHAASEGFLVSATHMPFPSAGRIVRDAGRLGWIGADWDYRA